MLEAIRNKLLTIDGLGVYYPNVVNSKTPKPYAVIRFANETKSNINIGYDSYLNIYIYVTKNQYKELDLLKRKVVLTLINSELIAELTTDNNFSFNLDYIGTIGNQFDDTDFNASGLGLSFKTDLIIGG